MVVVLARHMKKKTILIVEDEQILGELLAQKLKEEGYTVFWELDGEAGLRKMREITPDMVLLDIIMPKKDGYGVIEAMQKDGVLKHVPIIVISNSGQPVEIKRILELGVKDYVVKAQFSPAEVLAKVRKYLDATVLTEKANASGRTVLGVKILVVEDDPFLSSIAVDRLEREGYTVSVATDGEHALSVLAKDIPDLVLLDIVMPGVNGFEVLKAIKADARWKDVSVVIFSNLGQEHEIEEGKKLGADDFLVKAKFTPLEVLRKIQDILKKKGRI